MELALIGTAIVFGGLALYSILFPLIRSEKPLTQHARLLIAQLEELEVEKESLLESLRDLELDHQLEKLSEQDYRKLKENLLGKAVHIYRRLESLEREDEVFAKIAFDLDQREKKDSA